MVVMHFSEVVRVVFLFINPLFFEVVVVLARIHKEKEEGMEEKEMEEEDAEVTKAYVDDVDYLEDKLRLNNLTATLLLPPPKVAEGLAVHSMELLGAFWEYYLALLHLY